MPNRNPRDSERPQADRSKRSRAPRGGRTRGLGMVRFCSVLVMIVIVAAVAHASQPVRSATVEAGTALRPELFVRNASGDAAFITDVSAIDTSRPGQYELQVSYKGKTRTVTLTVQDTVPPEADGKTLTAPYGQLPAAADCVENIRDATAVSAQWEQAPDMQQLDVQQTGVVRLTDESGNSTDVRVLVTVKYDAEPPKISGARDIKAFLGESIAYRDGVTVTDENDPAPTLTIDSSGVNMDAEGVYTATYTASDADGNTSSVTVSVTIEAKPSYYVEEEEVFAVAREYYDQIINDDMTQMEKAFAIYRWVKGYIYYEDHSDHEYWTVGAYQAFTRLAGDCYIYFSAAKALLTMAGIETCDVVKSDTSVSAHFWLLINLGYGWYHFDACPRVSIDTTDDSFMLTDEEMEQYSQAHQNSNVFDPDLYPERAAKSVQQYVNYEGHVVHDPGW